jgi:hypothetical protein
MMRRFFLTKLCRERNDFYAIFFLYEQKSNVHQSKEVSSNSVELLFLKGQLADCQHGFDKGRSTVLNLLEYSSFVLKSIEDRCQVDSIYTDFSKAFDKVRHRLKPMAPTILERGLPICGLRPNHVCEVSR